MRLPLIALSIALLTSGPLVRAEVFHERIDEPQAATIEPSFEDVLGLSSIENLEISPLGDAVVYEVHRADWQANRYESEIFYARPGEEPFQLTRTQGGSSRHARFSPDGAFIYFLADRGDGEQIHRIRARGGEARPLTRVPEGLRSFEVSPDGRSLVVLIQDAESAERDKMRQRYGDFAVEDGEDRPAHLWLLDLTEALECEDGAALPEPAPQDGEGADGEGADDEAMDDSTAAGEAAWKRLTGGEDFTVTDVAFSPDGKRLAFTHQPAPSFEFFNFRDISLLELEGGEIRPLVSQPGLDYGPVFSPDGEQVVFHTRRGRTEYYVHTELAMVPANGGENTPLTADFDEEPRIVAWLPDGIRFTAYQRTRRLLFELDPESLDIEEVETATELVEEAEYAFAGSALAYVGSGRDGSGTVQLGEVYWRRGEHEEKLTAMNEQVAGWPLGSREVIRWQSHDGLEIEGVLWKPADLAGSGGGGVEAGADSNGKRPLLVAIHGGPTGISTPRAVAGYVYPYQHWLMKGALILEPNYRGSAGYGNDFRGKNYRNLGVGDAWDVVSGVEHLVEEGLVDAERIGAMGWSQGGYISAFLATTSELFQAISMGAGISNWITYYVNTDIHPFTRHYLGATPWKDPEVYARTSPMTYIEQAKTPLLIQHGESDSRVPIPNAYEIYQGVKDQGTEARLIVYKGFGHVINKPKERLAAVWHNWQFFAEHLWGETVEIPLD